MTDQPYPSADELKRFWKEFRAVEHRFYMATRTIEKKMNALMKRNDLELFFVDGECAGIGSNDRKMTLIHDTELDEPSKGER